MKGYGLQLTPKIAMDNFIYKFGDIFDAIRDVILFLTADDRGEYNLPSDAGYGLGTAIYLILNPSQSYGKHWFYWFNRINC